MWRYLLQYMQDYPAHCRLKQTANQLILIITGQFNYAKQVKYVLSTIGVAA